MRGQIFGLGLAQVAAAIAALSLTGAAIFGFSGPVAFIAGAGFVLSSTAVIMSVLQDRGEISSAEGQKSVAILLFEDLMIVPLLAVVAFLSPLSHGQAGWTGILVAMAALVGAAGGVALGTEPVLRPAGTGTNARGADGGRAAGGPWRSAADGGSPACRWRWAHSSPA